MSDVKKGHSAHGTLRFDCLSKICYIAGSAQPPSENKKKTWKSSALDNRISSKGVPVTAKQRRVVSARPGESK